MWSVKEAEEKWCPMARIVTLEDGDVANVNMRNDPMGNCFANQCMMWVWLSDDNGYCGLINTDLLLKRIEENE